MNIRRASLDEFNVIWCGDESAGKQFSSHLKIKPPNFGLWKKTQILLRKYIYLPL